MFFLNVLYKRTDGGVFDDFPKISDHFPKISENFPKLFEGQTNVSNIFRKFPQISEDVRDFRRLPRLSRKTRRCFDDTPTNLSTI